MSRTWNIALVQATPLQGADRVAELANQVHSILAQRPTTQMVVFPEIHLFGDPEGESDPAAFFPRMAQPVPGAITAALAAVACAAGVWLIPGSIPEQGEDDRVYNTAVVFNPAGELVSSYRKVFPWRPHEPWASGSSFSTFDVPAVGRMGINICYDSWFPEATRQIAWKGAEVVLNLVKTTTPDRRQELILAQANAITNQIYYLSVNAAGPTGWGQSIHVGPEGEILAQLPDAAPDITHLELDLDRVTHVRSQGTAGLNRPWQQLRTGDEPIDLPAYAGEMTAARWEPQSRENHL